MCGNLMFSTTPTLWLFFYCVTIIRTSIFRIQLGKPQSFAFALSKFFSIPSNLLSPYSSWQTSRPAFAFPQADIFLICVSFFTSNLNSQHSTSALFNNRFLFRLCSQKKKITTHITGSKKQSEAALFAARVDVIVSSLA